jgi:alcohol dehydrogenase class IV
MPDFSNFYEWSTRSYDYRLHVGSEAIENQLKEEVIRNKAQRAFLFCSPSIKSKTNSVERVQNALGPLFAGYFDQIHMEGPYQDIVAATEAARAARADLLIALGAGSIVVAARIVNIYMCETGAHEALATQYPEGKPAFSPRLNAPKLPSICIPTTPTGAMNRGGQALPSPHLNQMRLEYFDPKTRPAALIWDHQAIMATPFEMMRGFCVNGYVGSSLRVARANENPLTEGNRNHINFLHNRAYHRMLESPDTIDWRLDLFTAALLDNRTADDSLRGSHMREREVFDGDYNGLAYGLSSSLHIRYPHVWQQDGNAAIRPAVIRQSKTPSAEKLEKIAQVLGIARQGHGAPDMQIAIADEIARIYKQHGIPASLRELSIPKEDFPVIAKDSLKVFNSNTGMRFEEEHMKNAIAMLEAAW